MNELIVPSVTVRLIQKSIKTSNTPAIVMGMMSSRYIIEHNLQLDLEESKWY